MCDAAWEAYRDRCAEGRQAERRASTHVNWRGQPLERYAPTGVYTRHEAPLEQYNRAVAGKLGIYRNDLPASTITRLENMIRVRRQAIEELQQHDQQQAGSALIQALNDIDAAIVTAMAPTG